MKNRKNNPVQQINIRPPPLPQPETKSQPKPEPKPQAPINSPENIKPVIKDSLVPQTKEIKVQTKNAMPKNDIQFKDNNAQIKIKVDKTFNVYNIDERSIIDGSGNVVSFDKVITNTVNNDIR